MPSETSICNQALLNIGEEVITDINDTTVKAARTCKTFFDDARRASLRGHPWNFALKRVSLPADVAAPVWGFSTQYSLPADFLKLIDTDDPDNLFKVEGEKLLSDNSGVKILYIFDEEDVTKFDTSFVEAFVAKLAFLIALPLTQDPAVKSAMGALFDLTLSEARTMNAQETSYDKFEANVWLNERL